MTGILNRSKPTVMRNPSPMLFVDLQRLKVGRPFWNNKGKDERLKTSLKLLVGLLPFATNYFFIIIFFSYKIESWWCP
jgi:hypothetical protein